MLPRLTPEPEMEAHIDLVAARQRKDEEERGAGAGGGSGKGRRAGASGASRGRGKAKQQGGGDQEIVTEVEGKGGKGARKGVSWKSVKALESTETWFPADVAAEVAAAGSGTKARSRRRAGRTPEDEA